MAITLTPHQQSIFDECTSNIENALNFELGAKKIIDISGPAGTGKTVLSVQIINWCLKNRYKVKATAPTHAAARVTGTMLSENGITIETGTIHSHLMLKQTPSNSKLQDYVLKQSNDISKIKEKVDVLIIDESSMVSSELYKFIVEGLDAGAYNCVVFIGDEFQLEPADGINNPVYEDKNTLHLKLEEVVRQAKDSPIIYLATKFREAIENDITIDIDKIFTEVPYLDSIYLHTDTKKWIQSYLDNDSNNKKLIAYTNETVHAYNAFIRTVEHRSNDLPFLLKGESIVFQGAVTARNNKGEEYMLFRNSQEHTIKNIFETTEQGMRVMNVDGSRIIHPDSIPKYNTIKKTLKDAAIQDKKVWFGYYNFIEKYVEVKHLYACTIHKSQGSTYESAWLNLNEIKKYIQYANKNTIYRLIYVSLTRVSESIHVLL